MKRKYSTYYIIMNIVALLALMLAVLGIYLEIPTAVVAVLCVLSFILWYSALMAPDSDKYTDEYNEYLYYTDYDPDWDSEVMRGR